MKGHTEIVSSVVINNENEFCISGSMDSTIKVWSLKSGNKIHELIGHSEGIHSVRYLSH